MSLQVSGLSYQRGQRLLFQDINFELNSGEMLWLKGANGSGKSSLLRLLCGLSQPDAGLVRWKGEKIQNYREQYAQDLLYHAHAIGVKDELLAWENLMMSANIHGRHCQQRDALQAIHRMGMAQVAELPARVLSQGQKKRLALASLCLPFLPQLLILDEPFTALDQASMMLLSGILSRHLDTGGMIIYTTHQEMGIRADTAFCLELGG